MKILALQTGSVRIKTAQIRGRGRGLRRRLSVFTDGHWTPWLPTFAWVIDHPDGVIVVDTGQGAHLLEATRSLHPYHRWEVAFRLELEEEIGPQLRVLGIGPRDVKQVVLTHLHVDHDGGLAHFPQTKILVSRGELTSASGWKGRLRGYLPQRWPTWFDPVPLDLSRDAYGPFSASTRLTTAGDVVAVATPGHTPNHLSVVVEDQGTTYFLAGDASYDQRLMLAGRIDGVSPDDDVAAATLRAISRFATSRRMVYLPTHDPESAVRLADCVCVADAATSTADVSSHL
jgi:glyoxylase-like metal-dependent hydrolase (beta-lactamase superfamily II)